MKYTSKNLFDFLKSLGKLQEYSDYEDFRQKKYGINKTEEIKKEELEKTEDKEDFDYVFGDDVDNLS